MAVRLEPKHIEETLPELVRLTEDGLTPKQISERLNLRMGIINRLFREHVDPVTQAQSQANMQTAWGR